MNPQDVFKDLINLNVIKPHRVNNIDSDDNDDDDDDVPPLVKRRRLQGMNKENNVSVFSGIEDTAGPSCPNVAVPVVSNPVRRRLNFMEREYLSSSDSDESIENPFTSDDSSDLSNPNTKEYTELTIADETAVTSTPADANEPDQPSITQSTFSPSCLADIVSSTPLPHSPLPPTPQRHRCQTGLQKQKDKHPILGPCHCKNLCMSKINQERRVSIHSEYWSKTYNDRRNWMFNSLVRRDRGVHRDFYFTNNDGFRIKICGTFFLHTLGYSSNSVIKCLDRVTSRDSLFVPNEKRGKKNPPHMLNAATETAIDEHIESFHPQISHYRRAHAPKRRYLSPDLTIRDMHGYFKEQPHPEEIMKVSYETYRLRVSRKGISFAKLGVEECEHCMAYAIHEHSEPDNNPTCQKCIDQANHVVRYTRGRIHYVMDSECDPAEGSTVFVSADMQKVIMLPYMTGVKTCAFVNRLIAFHQTFAPLGEQGKKSCPRQVVSVLWHEGISGRSASDVTSAFMTAISSLADDGKRIVIWCDNCSAQNKNWILYTSLIRLMNDQDQLHVPDDITLKYLETGHTFLSADSFHGLVEKNMRKKKKTI